ncbi:MAG: peptidylprolyl isomerase [bacterium]
MALSVNGIEINEAKIQDEMTRLRLEYEAYVRTSGGEPSETQLREWAEENVIEDLLFLQEAVTTQPLPSDERAQQCLNASAELFKEVPQEERLARSKEALQKRRLMKEIRKGVKPPSAAELRAYYDAHPELFVMPEALRLSHICRFVKRGDKTATFLELLRIKTEVDGSRLPWMKAVETYSESYARDDGFFEAVSRGDLPLEVEEKLFALKQGEVSDVLELGGQTLHLFKLLVKEPSRKLDVKDIRERLSEVLFEDACQEALEAKFDALKAAAVIQREAQRQT